jgi:hypothetical protein
MQPEPQMIIDWLKGRTQRLGLLAADLVESRQAFVELDVDTIYRHNLQQQALCQEIQRLDREILLVQNSGVLRPEDQTLRLDGMVGSWDEQSQEALRSVLKEHEAVRGQVCEISRVQTELLRRSRRYLRVLSNLVSNSMGLYAAPENHSALSSEMRGL